MFGAVRDLTSPQSGIQAGTVEEHRFFALAGMVAELRGDQVTIFEKLHASAEATDGFCKEFPELSLTAEQLIVLRSSNGRTLFVDAQKGDIFEVRERCPHRCAGRIFSPPTPRPFTTAGLSTSLSMFSEGAGSPEVGEPAIPDATASDLIRSHFEPIPAQRNHAPTQSNHAQREGAPSVERPSGQRLLETLNAPPPFTRQAQARAAAVLMLLGTGAAFLSTLDLSLGPATSAERKPMGDPLPGPVARDLEPQAERNALASETLLDSASGREDIELESARSTAAGEAASTPFATAHGPERMSPEAPLQEAVAVPDQVPHQEHHHDTETAASIPEQLTDPVLRNELEQRLLAESPDLVEAPEDDAPIASPQGAASVEQPLEEIAETYAAAIAAPALDLALDSGIESELESEGDGGARPDDVAAALHEPEPPRTDDAAPRPLSIEIPHGPSEETTDDLLAPHALENEAEDENLQEETFLEPLLGEGVSEQALPNQSEVSHLHELPDTPQHLEGLNHTSAPSTARDQRENLDRSMEVHTPTHGEAVRRFALPDGIDLEQLVGLEEIPRHAQEQPVVRRPLRSDDDVEALLLGADTGYVVTETAERVLANHPERAPLALGTELSLYDLLGVDHVPAGTERLSHNHRLLDGTFVARLEDLLPESVAAVSTQASTVAPPTAPELAEAAPLQHASSAPFTRPLLRRE